ncbi:hypothetical protein DSCW_41800 [Desulfosarcina widdelii]|uniref:Uncharacterized protein n=1 Tax=Desulfosarcina widdelii TaxID=947919 RepID=A0A5K7ZAC8_9BACT|nr:hypothetical protein [Desulfosarcina widdelii]BBO76763.1 hypothetical protein DSCW_41800 [Desulfosarcina widdelii]
MLDVAVAYNRYKFIGHEFLTWLWFIIESEPDVLRKADETLTSLTIGNRIVLENAINDASEIITIKGDDAGLEEGQLSLRKGAVVIEINLSYKSENQEWAFTLKGESLSFSSLKVPETGPVETGDDIEGMVLEKIYLYEKTVQLIRRLFHLFVKTRSSVKWKDSILPKMKKWIQAPPDSILTDEH